MQICLYLHGILFPESQKVSEKDTIVTNSYIASDAVAIVMDKPTECCFANNCIMDTYRTYLSVVHKADYA